MANELLNDGKYIFINTPYAEAYIPDELFDNLVDADEPKASSLAYDTGEGIVTIGLFYMRFFDSAENVNSLREKTAVRTLNYPNKIETHPSGTITKEELTFFGISDKYRVLRYEKGDILMEATSKKAPNNVEMLTRMVFNGKMPRSLSYEDIYLMWKKSFEINGVNANVPPVLLQAMVAKMCRNPRNTSEEFRFLIGKDAKTNPRDFVMLSLNQVSSYSSVMSSMSFERFAEKLTTSLVMTKEGIPQEKSPIEQVITI